MEKITFKRDPDGYVRDVETRDAYGKTYEETLASFRGEYDFDANALNPEDVFDVPELVRRPYAGETVTIE